MLHKCLLIGHVSSHHNRTEYSFCFKLMLKSEDFSLEGLFLSNQSAVTGVQYLKQSML